jgi:hypothetical protein
MGTKKGILASAIFFLLLLSVRNVAAAPGQGLWGDRSREPEERLGAERLLALLDSDRVKSYLALDDSQAERLRQIALDTEKAHVKVRAEIQVHSIDLKEGLRAEKPDRDAILKKVQEISELRGQLMKSYVEAILSAKAVLSPEQQRKIVSLIENRGEGGPAGEERQGRRARPRPRQAGPSQPAPTHPDEPPVQ